MKILAIETSCDETAISIIEASGDLPSPEFKTLAHCISSQIKLHAEWGGVVPMLAKREHQKNFTPLLKEALSKAGLLIPKNNEISPSGLDEKLSEILGREPELNELLQPFLDEIEVPEIDMLAVTVGPGLEPALWVGVSAAKALALAWNKPLMPVNHMAGHLYSVLADKPSTDSYRSSTSIQSFDFPAIGLLISGGHTELVLARDWMQHEVIGQTRDDAVGEAFDKVARLLDLPYPGGPEISKLAAQFSAQSDLKNSGDVIDQSLAQAGGPSGEIRQQANIRALGDNVTEITLPRPMLHSHDLDFSFSGLKTAVLYLVKKLKASSESDSLTLETKSAIAYEFQQACIDVLLAKTIEAIEQYNAQSLIIGGGVVANLALRERFTKIISEKFPDITLHIPDFSLATDNATMIGIVAYLEVLLKRETPAVSSLVAKGNLSL